MVEPHRTGEVALLGLPNSGKSTLMNRLVGEKLAIVTPKPQTTRGRLVGILSLPGAQILLVDTPGLHGGKGALHEAMQRAAAMAAESCDLALVLVDLGVGWEPAHDALVAKLSARGTPWIAVGTKADLPPERRAPWPPEQSRKAVSCHAVSARTGEGLPALLSDVIARLPEGPAFHPEDELTDRPVRFLAAELVREAAFLLLRQEVPYGLAVEVMQFDESRPELVRIRANLLVARASQKQIVIGAGGAMIREIGSRARVEIERLLGTRVHLELWVKEEPSWTERRKRIEGLGYG
ncbi:MAG TPA: GTPase Era [Myxococcota bacterium]|jgi:GTP-binding protein Era|nr:GTPase Era [Myxococcota bacterium]